MYTPHQSMIVTIDRIARHLLPVVLLFGVTACSDSGRSTPAGGALPANTTVELSPRPAYGNNVLTVVIKRKAPGVEPVRYAVEWHKNGQVIDGAAGETLPTTFFRKGDVVTATVTAQNGLQQGVTFTSAPLTILNSLPVVMEPGMTPVPLYHHVAVHAVAQGTDADGDTVSYSYQWLKNGAIMPDQAGEILDGDLIEHGDRIQVQAAPFDGTEAGEPRLSFAVTVQNSPPKITSQPTASLDKNDAYLYQVVAEDRDGDPIIYSLTSSPSGMTIDPQQGLIRWKVTKQDKGIYPIEITVANADGAKTMQRYDLRIDDLTIKPTPPPS